MSSERLRQAAQRIRCAAQAATPGRWEDGRNGDVYETQTPHGDVVAEMGLRNADAALIALIASPPVALAVARLLDTIANDLDTAAEVGRPSEEDIEAAVVADAVLGPPRSCECPEPNHDCEHPTCPRYPQPGHRLGLAKYPQQ